MNTRHTPGPWQVVTDPDKMGDNWMICSGGDWVIETTNLKIDECGDPEADAQVIAAAPDGVALGQALIEWDEYCSHLFDDLHLNDGWRALIDQARAFVARATGEPS